MVSPITTVALDICIILYLDNVQSRSCVRRGVVEEAVVELVAARHTGISIREPSNLALLLYCRRCFYYTGGLTGAVALLSSIGNGYTQGQTG